jgi:retinol dehydrogenase-12
MTNNHLMEDKIVLVTGATGGIGFVTALELARMGARMLLVGRNPEKCRQSAEAITIATGSSKITTFIADLSSLRQIRGLAEEVKGQVDRLDVLVNNAGAIFMDRQVSADGYEMTLALNHLNYFHLTNLLLDLLGQSPSARIVNVSSMAHAMGRIDFDDLQSARRFQGWGAYSNSKLANVLFTYELARRLADRKITVNCLHPGFVASNFGRSNGGFFEPFFRLSQVAAISPQKGAETSIYLASSPEVEGVTGKYFARSKAVPSSALSYNVDVAARLWQASEELVLAPNLTPVSL